MRHSVYSASLKFSFIIFQKFKCWREIVRIRVCHVHFQETLPLVIVKFCTTYIPLPK